MRRRVGEQRTTGLLDARDVSSGGPSFSLRNRVQRASFALCWTIMAAWTPPALHRWRCLILRLFGARVGIGVRIYASTKIWHPANLNIGDAATIGPRVRLYNQGRIAIGSRAVISQGAHICASTHDVTDPFFQLMLRPVTIGDDAWIAADSFVGPGVEIGTGAVLGARGAAFRRLDAWTIYGGNPATRLKVRVMNT
ncbi:putative colanic acid biosynthesis acetyltransferase WcaF [Sphingomonas faeni]|uniref:Putative colanic acid biosynthesis acetyltransferase WcaF n=1 Tax=Sphingomonas faeni TaxID=185950 RepID=A0A2T5TXN4_9SPHN|nr:putative colanic acid biosynthesis acetyltransferase WcaF [Sphingomonas faeni]